MKSNYVIAALGAAALALTALGAPAHVAAQPTIVDIDGTQPTTTDVIFAAGTYDVSWIDNTAHGGYNGWSAYNSNQVWREAFSFTYGGKTQVFDKDGPTHYLDVAGSTAANALAAFQSGGPYLLYGASGTPTSMGSASFTLTAPTVVSFSVPDYLWTDNTGGVSLKITAAVPEPETVALMLAGLVGVGFAARRREAQAA